MKWKTKAVLQNLFAITPRGDKLYAYLQKRVGQLRAGPDFRLPQFKRLAELIELAGGKIEGANFVELGTGHVSNIPLCLSMCGAAQVHTFDLHPRLQLDLVAKTMKNLLAERDRYEELFSKYASADVVADRFDLLAREVSDPLEALKALGIHYKAPLDARVMPFDDGEIDYCVSVTVLEHIEPNILGDLLAEERRVCSHHGQLVHLVDLSDHFSHSDKSIPAINFLRFSDRAWKLIAGNEFGYCNRLRINELVDLVKENGLKIDILKTVVDERSHDEISGGFPLAEKWKDRSIDDLCTTQVGLVASNSQGNDSLT